MILLNSFSVTYRDNFPAVPAVTSTTVMQSFSVSALLISPGIQSNVVCKYFTLTIPGTFDVDPFGLITHKKK